MGLLLAIKRNIKKKFEYRYESCITKAKRKMKKSRKFVDELVEQEYKRMMIEKKREISEVLVKYNIVHEEVIKEIKSISYHSIDQQRIKDSLSRLLLERDRLAASTDEWIIISKLLPK